MYIKKNDTTLCWVRKGFCVTACLAILGLIYIASTGTDIPLGLTAMVGVFVLNISGYAFHGRSTTELILEFLKNRQR